MHIYYFNTSRHVLADSEVICAVFVDRDSLCSTLHALDLHLGEIAKTGEKLANYHEIIIQLDRQNEIFKDALSTPDHPLITMQDK